MLKYLRKKICIQLCKLIVKVDKREINLCAYKYITDRGTVCLRRERGEKESFQPSSVTEVNNKTQLVHTLK